MPVVRVLLLLLVLLPVLPAHATADVPDRSTAIDFDPLPDSQRFRTWAWAADSNDAITLLGQHQLLRLPGDGGSPQVSLLRGHRFELTGTPPYLESTGDGGVIGTLNDECSALSFEPDGQLRWWATALATAPCLISRPLVRGELGVVAIRPASDNDLVVTALDSRGQSRWRTVLAPPNKFLYSSPLLVGDDQGVYVAATHASGGANESVEIFALDDDGNLRWHWSSPVNERLHRPNLAAGLAGGLEIGAFDALNQLVLFRLRANGTLRLRQTVSAEEFCGISVLPRADGGGYVLGSRDLTGVPSEVLGYSSGGSAVWRHVLDAACTGALGTQTQCAWLADDGDLLVFGGNEPGVLERYRPDGTRRFVRTYDEPGAIRRPVFALSGTDGRVAVGVRTWRTEGARTVQHDHLEWLDSGGSLIEQLHLPDEPDVTPSLPGPFAVEDEGAATVLVQPSDTAPIRRLRLDADGAIEFDLPLPADLGRPAAASPCGAGGVCIVGLGPSVSIHRFDGNASVPSWSTQFDALGGGLFPQMRPSESGGVDLIEIYARPTFPGIPNPISSQRLSRIEANGSIGESQVFGGTDAESGLLVALSETGAYATLSRDGILRRFDGAGAGATHGPGLPVEHRLPMLQIPGVITRSGAVAYVTRDVADADPLTWPLGLVRVDVGGSIIETELGRWMRAAGAGEPAPSSGLRVPQIIGIAPFGGDSVVVGLEQVFSLGAPHRAEVYRVGADGQILWRRGWNNRDEHDFELVVDDQDRILVSSRRQDGGWVARALDADGTLLDQRQPRCADGPCRIERAALAGNGTVLGFGVSGGDDQPHGHRVWQLRGMFEPGTVRLDEPGLTGTWYDPANPGQGFTLRRYPGDGGSTVFLPWFTFSADGGNEPDRLRWYTIQGTIEPGQREALLPVLANTGGRFDAPPATEARIVGQARLRFADCARGVLEYHFDAEHGGAEGSISLQRLLPPGMACGDVDAAAHDPSLSASWYDPATSGQGLDLYRIAGAGGSTGALFGSWYTYAPDTPTDTPADQRWFTLQGIADSGDGGWMTTIVQTLGGRLDGWPTWNHFRVGEAVLRSQDCQRLDLHYRFDDSADAGAFRGLDGVIELQRIGDCPGTP